MDGSQFSRTPSLGEVDEDAPQRPEEKDKPWLTPSQKIEALIGTLLLAGSTGMYIDQRRRKEKKILEKLRAVGNNTKVQASKSVNMILRMIEKMSPQAIAKYGMQLLAIAVVIGGLVRYWDVIKFRFQSLTRSRQIKKIREAKLSDYISMSPARLKAKFVGLVQKLTHQKAQSPKHSPKSKSRSKSKRSKSKRL